MKKVRAWSKEMGFTELDSFYCGEGGDMFAVPVIYAKDAKQACRIVRKEVEDFDWDEPLKPEDFVLKQVKLLDKSSYYREEVSIGKYPCWVADFR